MRIDNFVLRYRTAGANRDTALKALDGIVARFAELDEKSPGFPAKFFTRRRGRV